MFGLDDHFRAQFPFFDLQFDRTDLPNLFAAFLTQLLQPAQTPLIAFASGGYAFVQPFGFFLDFLVKILLFDDFLIDNPIDRYCINDRSGLQANDDGSVDVILSEDAPKDTTNWLPVGAGGFHLFMRIYTPDMDALETWMAPTITEIYPSNVN